MKSKKLVVFISGFGSNLQAIIDSCKSNEINATISMVLCNKKNAYGLERATKEGIPTFVSKDTNELFTKVDEVAPDLICLAGFMKIIPEDIVRRFEGKIINIHPSLLPQFPGLHSIEKAFNAKSTKTGVTIHYVDEGVDTGEIILQDEVPIDPKYTLEELEEKIHALEHKLYPKAINKLLNNL